MQLQYDQSLIDEFVKVLESEPPQGRQKEQVIQDFLEEHAELIPTSNRLGHQLHFDFVISKFALSPELTTDYVWLTKQSDRWHIVLVELESSDKEIFNGNMDTPHTSSHFNNAMNQVRSWKNFVCENKKEVLRRLMPLLQPVSMRENPVDFRYQLIIGRSSNKNATNGRKKYIVELEKESGIRIMTYDTIIDLYKNDRRYAKNIIRSSGGRFQFKHMHVLPKGIFSFLGPDVIELSKKDMENLRNAGYEIDAWSKGTLLFSSSDGKLTKETYVSRLPDKSLMKKVMMKD